MNYFLLSIQILSAVSLIGLILLQSSKGGISGGMSGEVYRSKRGAERIVFIATIVCAVIFLVTSIGNLIAR